MALLMLDLDNTLADRQAAFEHWLAHMGRRHPDLGLPASGPWTVPVRVATRSRS